MDLQGCPGAAGGAALSGEVDGTFLLDKASPPSPVPAPEPCWLRGTQLFEDLLAAFVEVSFLIASLPVEQLLCAVLVSNAGSKCYEALSVLINTNHGAIKACQQSSTGHESP